MRRLLIGAALAAICVAGTSEEASASSHREAPFVTKNPKVDSTDFYMFNSYETGRDGYVTILANYQPFQDAWGGPNYFELDPEALYEIHVDNDGDGAEDVTFQFRFHHALQADTGTVDVTLDGTTKTNAVPLLNIGGVSVADASKLTVLETYDLNVVTGDRRTGTVTSAGTGLSKPVDFIGNTTFGSAEGYKAYANSKINAFSLPGCTQPGRVFVGQRRESFAGNIGKIFDLVGAPGLGGTIEGGATQAGRGYNGSNPFDTGLLYNKNITTLAVEVHSDCLKAAGGSPIIGGWTSASLRQARVLNPGATYALPAKEGGAWTQVSRLGMPLVNEVVIGIKDKDNYGAKTPKDTANFADYVTNPTLPALLQVLYSTLDPRVQAPKTTRTDLVGVFATGLTLTAADGSSFNLNQTSTGPGNPGPSGNTLPAGIYEYLRLNTAVPATSFALQTGDGTTPAKSIPLAVHGLGALGCLDADRKLDTSLSTCDAAGFPNGRRPGDDVLDIALRVVMGGLFADAAVAPAHDIPFTDKNYNGAEQFDATFPYLRTPLSGSDNPYPPTQL